MNNPLRIAVIGPESSGKSELCMHLAEHFNTAWVPEYAREFLSGYDKKYTLDDIEHIFRVQFENEMKWVDSGRKIVFTDKEFIIGKVWCEHVFGTCPTFFNTMIRRFPYNLYLLTAADLPWQPDPLRENPGKGTFFFNWYEKILKEQMLSYRVISGSGDDRFRNGIEAMNQFIQARNQD